MPLLSTFSAASARPFGSSQKKLVAETFNADQTWVAPLGVNLLLSVVGHGANGTADTTGTNSYGVVSVVPRTDTNTGAGNATWSNFQGVAEAVAANLNNDGSASWTYYIFYVWPDGKNEIAAQNTINVTDAIPGTAEVYFDGDWQTSGAIASAGSSNVRWTFPIQGTDGAVASAFGNTFAAITTYNNVAVIAGNSYSIIVPFGGVITITYLK